MSVTDWDSFVGALRGVVIAVADQLPQSDIDGIWESIDGGEPGIAFEDLCTQLYEYEVPVSDQTLDVLSDIGAYTGFDPKLWEDLTACQ